MLRLKQTWVEARGGSRHGFRVNDFTHILHDASLSVSSLTIRYLSLLDYEISGSGAVPLRFRDILMLSFFTIFCDM